jgi:hypothetical protein
VSEKASLFSNFSDKNLSRENDHLLAKKGGFDYTKEEI